VTPYIRQSLGLAVLKHCFLVFTLCTLVACAGTPLNLKDLRLTNIARSSDIPRIPFYPQIEDQCGPSSLATMLGFQGVTISPEALRGKLYIPGKEGTVTTEIIARARRFGLLVYPLETELINILLEVNAGNPVLVMQNLGFNWLPAWHFSVVFGYDLARRKISLRSGEVYKQELDFSLFQKTWARADSWAIVIVPPEKLPRTATETGLIKAASQLEQVGEVSSALQAYRAMLAKWPDNAHANFGAGNAAFATGQPDEASAYFTDYLTLNPHSSKGWNNLAYSLAEKGCLSEAKKAIKCALKIEPENQNLLDSEQDIHQYPTRELRHACQSIDCLSR